MTPYQTRMLTCHENDLGVLKLDPEAFQVYMRAKREADKQANK